MTEKRKCRSDRNHRCLIILIVIGASHALQPPRIMSQTVSQELAPMFWRAEPSHSAELLSETEFSECAGRSLNCPSCLSRLFAPIQVIFYGRSGHKPNSARGRHNCTRMRKGAALNAMSLHS